jgi:Pyrimidine dimer DNA glycosylase
VQTFLPYADFERSARSLDQRRLGKQRVEGLQVLRGLTREGYGWRHHPAVKMWRGRLEALGRYTLTCCEVWVERGFGDSVATTVLAELAEAGVAPVRDQADLATEGLLPWWLGLEDFHRSHQSALLRKDPAFYRAEFGDVPVDLPYVWPSPEEPTAGRCS